MKLETFFFTTGFPIVRGGGHEGAPPASYNFFRKPPTKTDALPLGATPPLKNEAPHLKNKSPIE